MKKRILSTVMALIIGAITLNLTVFAQDANTAVTTAIENIAKEYSQCDLTAEGGNIYLVVADMMVYEELYPESENILSVKQKNTALEEIVKNAGSLSKPGDLSKAIIALRSLGYDAKNIYISENEKLDLVEKLTNQIDEKSEQVTDVFTIPYVIMALQQGEEYATDEQMQYLVKTVVEDKASWYDLTFGTDGLTPVIASLAPYYNDNDAVKTAVDEAVDEAVEILKGEQREDGLIDGYEGCEAASTALAIWGLSNLGIDSAQVIKGEKSLIDGLIEEGFSNAFAKEQGLRGLLAWKLLMDGTGKKLYDFSDYPMNAVNAPSADSPSEPTPDRPPVDDSDDDNKITIQIKVMVHNADECNNLYTYKSNSSKYYALVDEEVKIEVGQSVYDVLEAALEKNEIEFVESSYGYISSIDEYGEREHDNYSGWMFKVGGKHQNQGCRDTKLTKNTSVVWFYTDDYTKERQSMGGGLSLSESKIKAEKEKEEKEVQIVIGLENKHEDVIKKEIINPDKTFADISEHKDRAFIEALSQRGIIEGKTDESYEPEANMTRAEFAAIVVRSLGLEKNNGESFEDVDEDDWFYSYIACAYGYGIINGVSETKFAPEELITKEQASVMIVRAASLCGMDTEMIEKAQINVLAGFTDYVTASLWAKPALAFCYSSGILSDEEIEIQPKKVVNRSEIAVMVYNLLELSKLL